MVQEYCKQNIALDQRQKETRAVSALALESFGKVKKGSDKK